jgi:hypothetical protein
MNALGLPASHDVPRPAHRRGRVDRHDLAGHQPIEQVTDRGKPALNQHVEDLTLMIDDTPEIHPLAGDPDHHLVQMPSVARPRTPPSQPSCDHRSELQHPAPDGLIGDVEPTLGEEILYVSITEREAQVEPHSMLNDNWRKAVAAV